MNEVAFSVTGIPKAQPRPRACIRANIPFGTEQHAGVYDPPTAKLWKRLVHAAAYAARASGSMDGPLKMFVIYIMPRPQRMKRADPNFIPHIVKPDIDNLDKAFLDALTMKPQPSWWRDDCTVADLHSVKVLAMLGGEPGAYCRITQIDIATWRTEDA